jgi:hypothetical protein
MSQQQTQTVQHPLSRMANLLVIVAHALRYEVGQGQRNGRAPYSAYADEIERMAGRLVELADELGAALPG